MATSSVDTTAAFTISLNGKLNASADRVLDRVDLGLKTLQARTRVDVRRMDARALGVAGDPLDGEREHGRDRYELVVLGLASEWFALLLVHGLIEPVPELPAVIRGVVVNLQIAALLAEVLSSLALAGSCRAGYRRRSIPARPRNEARSCQPRAGPTGPASPG